MAGIFTRFTLRSLAQNRVRTAVTVVGIALSTALLAAVLTSVASVQQGLLELKDHGTCFPPTCPLRASMRSWKATP